MVNPTNSFDPAVNPFEDKRYLRVGLHELADGTFVNVSPGSPLPVAFLSAPSLAHDAWGRNKVVNDKTLLHGMFTFNVPVNMWYETLDAVEQTSMTYSTSVDGALNTTSNALNQKVGLQSFRHPRYEPNRGALYSTAAILPDIDNAGERTFGTFTAESGVGFRVRDGVLYAWRRSTESSTTTDYEEVITVPTGIDLEKGNIYDVQYQWRGVGSYFFYINGALAHTMALLGTLTGLSIFNPAMPIAFECTNQGDAVTMQFGCVDVSSEGGENNGKTYGSIQVTSQTGSVAITGYNVPVLAVRSKVTVNSLINTRDTLALLSTGYGDQRAVIRIWATRDNTAITENDQSWADFGDGHLEFIEYDNPNVATPMTFDTTKAALIFGARCDQDQSYEASALFQGRTDVWQTPGDIFIFTMHKETGAAMNAGVTYEFAEAI